MRRFVSIALAGIAAAMALFCYRLGSEIGAILCGANIVLCLINLGEAVA